MASEGSSNAQDHEGRVIDQIGERMKRYEAQFVHKLDPTKPVLMRIDGHKFSKFTKGFKKPYDVRIHRSMVLTTGDLLKEFSPTLGYTQSDEITLVWPSCTEESPTFVYNGKVSKLVSLCASFATIRFTKHMLDQEWTDEEQHLKDKISSFSAYFDARVMNIPSEAEVYNNLLWRSAFDCRRNSVSALGHSVYSTSQLHKLGTTAVKKKLLEEKGIDWETQPDEFKFGTYVKKKLYYIDAVDQKTKEVVRAARTSLEPRSFLLNGCTPENVDMIFRKYW